MMYKEENFIPVNEYIILEPGKVKEINQEIEVPDETKNKGKKEDDIKETKKIKNKIKVEYRVGKILSMNSLRDDDIRKGNYEIGDWVAYNYRQAKAFDLLAKKFDDDKCPVIIKHWDVIAKVENDKLN